VSPGRCVMPRRCGRKAGASAVALGLRVCSVVRVLALRVGMGLPPAPVYETLGFGGFVGLL
jgi:hypothetical protein